MSVYSTITAKAAPGKLPAAMEWAMKVTEWSNKTYATGTEVLNNIGGDAWTIHWVAKFDSLAQYEETAAKFQADEEYQALLGFSKN